MEVLSPVQTETLLCTLKKRFLANRERHPDILWEHVQQRISTAPDKSVSLFFMESTGGEPDVIGLDTESGVFLFGDCSGESPSGRRSLCYDPEALNARKSNKPADSALGLAMKMGIEIMTEAQYRMLQTLGTFDLKTSSWVRTPAEIRRQGGAVFCDRRFGHVFLYHNGAESWYSSRGFRGILRV